MYPDFSQTNFQNESLSSDMPYIRDVTVYKQLMVPLGQNEFIYDMI